jgi:hypothetical protein
LKNINLYESHRKIFNFDFFDFNLFGPFLFQNEIEKAMEGHILDQDQLVDLYNKK